VEPYFKIYAELLFIKCLNTVFTQFDAKITDCCKKCFKSFWVL